LRAGRGTMNTGRTNSTVGRDVVLFVVSFIVHAVVLTWGMITFAAKPLPKNPHESLPVDIISVSEFTQLTAGAQNAPKAETPKPLAEKVAERKPVEDAMAKLEKKEVTAATDQAPPPMPEPKPPLPTEKKQSEPKRDLIAEAIKKDLATKSEPKKQEQKKVEAKAEAKSETKAEAKTPPKKDQPKFDPRRVEDLLNKRTPQRVAATGDVINPTPVAGARAGDAPALSLSELDAFRQKLQSCWSPPAGAPERIVVPITIRLKQDRTLAATPQPDTRASDAYARAVAESAVRAIIQCQPYTMFSVARYEIWKEITIDFDPVSLFGG
jgi:hypothetical protein